MKWLNSWMMMSNGFFRHNSADQDKKLDAVALFVEGVEVYRQRVAVSPSPQLLVLDQATAAVLYVGAADIGTAESAPAWQIKKVLTTDGITKILWAEGTADFVHIWADRASLTY